MSLATQVIGKQKKKNKNRSEAAKKRVRDLNGKFQGLSDGFKETTYETAVSLMESNKRFKKHISKQKEKQLYGGALLLSSSI